MGIKRFFFLFLAMAATALPLRAGSADSVRVQVQTLDELRISLREDYHQTHEELTQFLDDYSLAHREMMDRINRNQNLPMMLYNQDPAYTFSLSWILKEIDVEYERFREANEEMKHYTDGLDVEIERYSRLLESLQQRTVEPEWEECRDSCLFYAQGMLDFHKKLLDTIQFCQQPYREALLQLKETNDYVEDRFTQMQDYVFKDGQTPWPAILSNWSDYKDQIRYDLSNQYSVNDLQGKLGNTEDNEWNRGRGENTLLLYCGLIVAVELLLLCFAGILLVGLVYLIFKKFRPLKLNRAQRILSGLLLGSFAFLVVYAFRTGSSDIFIDAIHEMILSFSLILFFILTALLLRVEAHQLKACFRLYLPVIMLALAIILCRVSFMPDSLLTLVLAPILLLICIRQLIVCIRYTGKTDKIDLILGWVSFGIMVTALVIAVLGYTFAALLLLTWWFIQLAVILVIQCIYQLIHNYRVKRVKPRIDKYHARMAQMTGLDKKSLLFGFTWFYDLMTGAVLPVIMLLSIPFCLQATMDVFNLEKVFHHVFFDPFVHLTGKEGTDVLLISMRILVLLLCLFFVFRYLDKVIHSLWQSYRYSIFRRKNRRMKVRANEMNLSLGNSIISVLVWFIYIAICVITMRIPVGSLSLIAGGLSAGIGLALKDTINNFIYGIQLMSGRLRVGDYIICDGVRGKVSAISYQYTQLNTLDGNSIIFTNSTLFNKTFKNLTQGNSYEAVNIPITVSYGTDVERVRKLLLDTLKPLAGKDRFDRDIVDPRQGVNVIVSDFNDRGIEITVKQHVLVEERGSYLIRAGERIYQTLTENNVDMPFPQIDVHLHEKGAE